MPAKSPKSLSMGLRKASLGRARGVGRGCVCHCLPSDTNRLDTNGLDTNGLDTW